MGSTHEMEQGQTQPNEVGEFFSSLTSDALREFRASMSLLCYPAHAVLFEELQETTSILILAEGCTKISVNSRDGERLILWIARPVQFLGLPSVLRGGCHEVTAETVHPCRIASIPRQEFLGFLTRHPSAYQGIARELSMEMSRMREQTRTRGLPAVASIKLAWLLLDWSSGARVTRRGTSVSFPLTHEEMGQCIGATRETVSRAMADLRHRQLIELKGSALIIANRFALESFARGLHQATPRVAPAPGRAGRLRRPDTPLRRVTEITVGRHLS